MVDVSQLKRRSAAVSEEFRATTVVNPAVPGRVVRSLRLLCGVASAGPDRLDGQPLGGQVQGQQHEAEPAGPGVHVLAWVRAPRRS